MSHVLDEIDIIILKHLQKNGRAQRNKLAEIVNLSVPSVSERMRKLEERHLIEGYHAIMNAKRFHFDITAFIFVDVSGSALYPAFVKEATLEPEVLECHSITGDGSHVLKVRTRDTEALEQLLGRIQSWPGVMRTRSNVVLSSFKETREIPIERYLNVAEYTE
jgi:Lrp/AsnC family leucine-responsive transcriptional regulator